jgi:hypothetical protein
MQKDKGAEHEHNQTQELAPLRISSDGEPLVRERCGETVQDVPAWPKQR